MIKIEELIKKLCPNGVAYYALNKVFDNFNGMTGVSNKWKENGNCRFIEYMNAYKNLKIKVQQLPLATVKKLEQNTLKKGDILHTSASETPDECAISSVIEDEIQDNVFLDDHLFGLRLKEEFNEKINTIFINYYMHTRKFRRCVNKTVRGVTRFYISVSDFMNICIPVPPLEVQDEIVRILDDFTLLSAELKARQVQYEYYRDKLLENKNKTQVVFLEDILKIKNGKDYKHLGNGDIPVYGTGGIMTYVNQYSYNKPSVLIPRKGSLDKLYYVDKPFWNVDTIFYTEIDESKAIPKYIYYYLQNEHLEKLNKAGGVPSLTQTILNKIKIVLPNIEIQNKIINVLDNFDTICSDLKIGLPAEIEARQKQYEFYRDTLLTYAATGEIIFKDKTRQDKTRQAIIRLIQYVFGSVEITLGEIGNVCMCKRIMKNETNSISGIPFYKIGTFGKVADAYISEELFEEYKNKYSYPKKGDVLISASGTIGRTVIFNGEKSYFQDSNIIWIDNNEQIVTNKFLKYLYSTIEWQVENGTIKRLYNNNLKKTKIIIPSIEKQNEIVRTLDNFEKIITDIQEGLPAEIEARKKQYEYYRDKLLTFKELEIKEG